MSVRNTVTKQYRSIVDNAIVDGRHLRVPKEGWIATVRKALGMSGAQLAQRYGVGRARISQAERSERVGGITLKALEGIAESMNCRLVYAVIPKDGSIEELIAKQAQRRANAVVDRAKTHMALEAQSLPEEGNQEQIDSLAEELARTMPGHLWTEK